MRFFFSPPPCGEGSGMGVSSRGARGSPPSQALPHKGGGNREARHPMSPSDEPVDATLPLPHRFARTRLRVPLPTDRDPGDLFVQRLAAGHGVGWLVAALVWRILPRSHHAGGG